MKKIFLILITLYFFTILQTSFLIYFSIFGLVLNLVFIFVILLNSFERIEDNTGMLAALLGGFFLDVFSSRFFGFYTLILVFLSLIIKYVIKKHINPVIKFRKTSLPANFPFHG